MRRKTVLSLRDGSTWSGVATLAALGMIASPAVSALAPSIGDGILLASSGVAVPLVALRVRRVGRIVWWVLALVLVYAVGSAFRELGDQGSRHTLTLISSALVLLLFAAYGREIVGRVWFRVAGACAAAGGIIAFPFTDLSKNIAGGATLYLTAFIFMLVIARRPRSAGVVALVFGAVSVTLSLTLDFRSMVLYSALFVVSYLAYSFLPKKVFSIAGLIVMAGTISFMLWLFLNTYTSKEVSEISQVVEEYSGRRANSGRDWLWPLILNATSSNPILGLGSGFRPQDLVTTAFSAHSYYLQLYLQVGLLGVALLVAILLAVWVRLSLSRSKVAGFGAAVFVMFVIHNGTEVLMFQNGLIASVAAWCTIGLGYAYASAPTGGEAESGAAGQRPRAIRGTGYGIRRVSR